MKKIIFLFIFCALILTVFTTIKAQEFDINFTSSLSGEIAGDVKVAISTTKKADKVYFKIEGTNFYKEYASIKDDEMHYHFIWPTYEMPDSAYKLIAIAVIEDTKFSKIYGTKITNSEKIAAAGTNQIVNLDPTASANQTDTAMPKKTVTADASPADTITPEKTGIMNTNPATTTATPPKTETADISPTNIATPTKAETANVSPTTAADSSKKETTNINPTTAATAPLKTETAKINPTTAAIPEKTTTANTIPSDTIEPAKTASTDNTLAEECKNAKIFNAEDCNTFLNPPREVIQECKDAGIKTFEQCDLFLRLPRECWERKMSEQACKEFMSINPECRAKEILNAEACAEMLKIPAECRAKNITNKIKCEQFIYKSNLPKECADNGLTTIEECNKFIFLKNLPEECKKANVFTKEECNKILNTQAQTQPQTEPQTKANISQKCKDANISDPQKCDDYMRANTLSEECKKENITNQEECKKLMEALAMPEECKRQGITKKEECELYLIKKNMPKECLDANIKTRAECDELMFKKYSPEECKQAGIENEGECKDFMANKYAKKIKCEGLDESQCAINIKENHLGDIAANSAITKEIKKNAAHFSGETMEAGQLEEKIKSTAKIIPVARKETKLKIMTATEATILDKNDTFITTSPLALMFDTDGDGLTDEMEKRMDTDPENPDSDGDGYTDGTEVKEKYNPLGAGKKDTATSPIDKAILENKTLGQPKTDGEFSKELTIEPIKNIEAKKDKETKAQGYALSGNAKPNSVISLYIYSDLPLIVTTQTDEFGNWQYELTESLIDGEHEIYVAINDNTGNIVSKSNPISFFIQEAKAMTVQDFVAAAPALANENAIIKTTVASSENLIKYYIIIAIAIVAIGILLFIIFLIQKKKQQI